MIENLCLINAARYVGVKEYVPPYLDQNLRIEELKTGVSFASAGTGFDPLTPKISVCYLMLSSFLKKKKLERQYREIWTPSYLSIKWRCRQPVNLSCMFTWRNFLKN